MSESSLWNWLRKYLPPGRYSRIESRTSPGIPDVSWTIEKNRTGWWELKVSRNPNARCPFKRGGLRPDQINWIREECQHGGNVKILARVGNHLFLISGAFAEQFNEMTFEDLDDNSMLDMTVREVSRSESNRNELRTRLFV